VGELTALSPSSETDDGVSAPCGRAVLVVAEYSDMHADAVVAHLCAQGVPVARFSTADVPGDCELSLDVRGGVVRGRIASRGRRWDLDDVGAAWFRRHRNPETPEGWPEDLRRYVRIQANAALLDLWAAISPHKWVNAPGRERVAERKLLQLVQAAQVGLDVPHTLVTTSAEDLSGFLETRGPRLAAKCLDVRGVYFDGEFRFPTTRVLTGMPPPPTVRASPTVFQPFVEKVADVRAVIIGATVHAAALDVGRNPEATYDFREALDGTWEPHSLPPRTAEALVALNQSFGLGFASADLLLDDAGTYWFIDLNPGGQWLWLEQQAGLPLSRTMAELLAARTRMP
jgi:hypothetical protein